MSYNENKPLIQPQDFFKRVPLSERKILFHKLEQQKLPLVVKGEFEDLILLVAFRLDENSSLYCATELETSPLQEGQSVVVNFSLEEERYFFLTVVGFESKIPFLKIDVDLFQLQRRQNMRFDIPDEYKAFANIIEFVERTVFIESRILDISAGGCRVAIEKLDPLFKMEDKLMIVLHLGHRRPLTFQVDVRFARVDGDRQILGLQYLGRDSIMENKLLSMMTDFQRELYLKYNADSGN